MTLTTDELQGVTGKVYSQDSDKIGNVGQIYLDDATGEPTWITVRTGLFGSAESFAPLPGATVRGEDLYLDFSEDQVKNAPRVDADGAISPQEEDELYAYYGLSGGADAGRQYDTTATNTVTDSTAGESSDYAAPVAGDTDTAGGYAEAAPVDTGRTTESGDVRPDVSAETVGTDRSGPTTDDAMTRSEERLNVGTATRESGRARLRKFVTTETVTQSVPVRHEEVTLEREPITDDNYDASQSGPSISEEEHEVVLHEEVPVVDKDVVAVERVKLGTETVTEDATVSEDVRKENIEMVDPDSDTSNR